MTEGLTVGNRSPASFTPDTPDNLPAFSHGIQARLDPCNQSMPEGLPVGNRSPASLTPDNLPACSHGIQARLDPFNQSKLEDCQVICFVGLVCFVGGG